MRRILMVVGMLLAVATTVAAVRDGEGPRRFREFLNGLKESPVIVSTTGSGTFRATVNRDETSIDYVLTFNNLEGDVTQAHIHIGHPQNQGNIVLWLCDSAVAPASPVASTPLCVQNDPGDFRNGVVTGTLTEADVITQTANGIAGPADFAEVVRLIRAGRTYANVHTVSFPPGEIRSQIDNGDDDHGNH